MNAITKAEFEVISEEPFYAPAPNDLVDSLIGQYKASRINIDKVAAMVAGDLGNVLHYFIEGNCGDDRTHRTLYVEKMFAVDGAIASLNSAFWSKALSLTDVYACMPQERKNAWNEQIRNPQGKKATRGRWGDEAKSEWEVEPLPNFEEDTVRSTITELLLSRDKFLAEKVDGIFRALSGLHVTNAPEAFGKRMIIAGVLSSYGSYAYERVGFLNDLRCVIAKFMGRDEPKHQASTNALVETAKHHSGQWIVADGGALKLRVYKVGTAHLEIHPEMAYRLNQILAHMHPHAIPAEFRQKPKRASKAFPVLNQPLPFAVLDLLMERQNASSRNAEPGKHVFRFNYDAEKSHPSAYAQAGRVLESIGGVRNERLSHHFEFDYDYMDALSEIRTTGCVPDKQAHQFYPTPAKLAEVAADMADIGEAHSVLEPSAGQGDLASVLPKDRTACVEVSTLHCAVLKSRGFEAHNADFIAWAASRSERYDRVVMNPPFSDGRWKAHLETAMEMLAPRGRVVAILPASARQSLMLDSNAWQCEWSSIYSGEFPGTSASVVILSASRK